MEPQALEFLKRILETPSPSGYERPVQDSSASTRPVFRRRRRHRPARQRHRGPQSRRAAARDARRPLRPDRPAGAATSTTTAFSTSSRSAAGTRRSLIGQRMTVWTAGGPVPGVIARKPIHLLTDEERKQVAKLKDLWLDIGAKDKEEAAAAGADRRPRDARAGLPADAQRARQLARPWTTRPACGWSSRRCGAPQGGKLQLRALRRLDRAGRDRPARRADQRVRHRPAGRHRRRRDARHRLPDDRQEAGRRHRARRRAGDLPRAEHEPGVVERLLDAAEGSAKFPFSLRPTAAPPAPTPTPCRSTARGVATGLVSIPNRYMHSPVEMVSLDDLDRAADLLAAFALGLAEHEDFTP